MFRVIKFKWYKLVYNFGLFVMDYFSAKTGSQICDWAFIRVGTVYMDGHELDVMKDKMIANLSSPEVARRVDEAEVMREEEMRKALEKKLN